MNITTLNIAQLAAFHYLCNEADRSGVMSLRQEYIGGSSAFSFNHQCHFTPINMQNPIQNERRPISRVYGVGINDVPKSSTSLLSAKEWYRMLMRCYSRKPRHNSYAYKDCLVCKEWLTFSNFKQWFDENHIAGYALDKDILVKNNKVYSPDTCCFVPTRINSLMIAANRRRGIYPIGVSSVPNGKYIARIQKGDRSKQIHIGTFDTVEEAFNAYKEAKEAYIKEVAQEYYDKDKITKKVYDALMRYEVETTD